MLNVRPIDSTLNINTSVIVVAPVVRQFTMEVCRKNRKRLNKLNMNQGIKSSNGHGGARAGAGRPKGSSNKIQIEELIDSLEKHIGMPYVDRFALNYIDAVGREDWTKVENYDRALLNKMVADRQDITMETIGDAAGDKESAFISAMNALININKSKDKDNASDQK